MIAFLHTADIHVNRFENLVRQNDKRVRIKHFVNEQLLKNAIRDGKADSVSFKNQIEKIKRENPLLLICTCSTYGEECQKQEDVFCIDQPVTDYIAREYQKIGLAYTVVSAKSVSEGLILKASFNMGKEIEIIDCNCTELWPLFEQKRFVEYEKGIARKIDSMAAGADAIFLAQASMEGSKLYSKNRSRKIMSSAEFGIKEFLKKI